MSDATPPLTPYSPPADPGYAPPTGPAPASLKAICIIAIILGGLGTATAVLGAVGWVLGQGIQSAFSAPATSSGENAEMEDFQVELQARINAVGKQYMPVSIVLMIAHLVAALMLLIGGIWALGLKSRGRSLLLTACGVCIVYELGFSVFNTVIQLEMIQVVRELMDRMLQSMPAGNAAGPSRDFLPGFMMAAFWAGLVITIVLALVKLSYYVISIVYLRKPSIAARFK